VPYKVVYADGGCFDAVNITGVDDAFFPDDLEPAGAPALLFTRVRSKQGMLRLAGAQ
jgi:hypothetical protein